MWHKHFKLSNQYCACDHQLLQKNKKKQKKNNVLCLIQNVKKLLV